MQKAREDERLRQKERDLREEARRQRTIFERQKERQHEAERKAREEQERLKRAELRLK